MNTAPINFKTSYYCNIYDLIINVVNQFTWLVEIKWEIINISSSINPKHKKSDAFHSHCLVFAPRHSDQIQLDVSCHYNRISFNCIVRGQVTCKKLGDLHVHNNLIITMHLC